MDVMAAIMVTLLVPLLWLNARAHRSSRQVARHSYVDARGEHRRAARMLPPDRG